MSEQMSLLEKFLKKAQETERALVPRILVLKGENTNVAVQNAINAGFPVTYGPPRFVAPSYQSLRSR